MRFARLAGRGFLEVGSSDPRCSTRSLGGFANSMEVSNGLSSQICGNARVIKPVRGVFNHSPAEFCFPLTLVFDWAMYLHSLVPSREKMYACGLL